MQYRVDVYIPRAFIAIENVKVNNKEFIDNEGSIPKEYKGYIASLGANIIQAGIRAALIFYEEEESGSKSDKRLINAAIKYMINNANDHNYSDYKLSEVLNGLSPEEQQQKAE
ncbi:MAG TPA: type III-B CRISPR module-associated protein Cmr5, partial [Paludibacteraceae bacterium]|nr:type III-B CRISPR module-associated protein Cmr5 [Paludibacteraceae bacterium]